MIKLNPTLTHVETESQTRALGLVVFHNLKKYSIAIPTVLTCKRIHAMVQGYCTHYGKVSLTSRLWNINYTNYEELIFEGVKEHFKNQLQSLLFNNMPHKNIASFTVEFTAKVTSLESLRQFISTQGSPIKGEIAEKLFQEISKIYSLLEQFTNEDFQFSKENLEKLLPTLKEMTFSAHFSVIFKRKLSKFKQLNPSGFAAICRTLPPPQKKFGELNSHIHPYTLRFMFKQTPFANVPNAPDDELPYDKFYEELSVTAPWEPFVTDTIAKHFNIVSRRGALHMSPDELFQIVSENPEPVKEIYILLAKFIKEWFTFTDFTYQEFQKLLPVVLEIGSIELHPMRTIQDPIQSFFLKQNARLKEFRDFREIVTKHTHFTAHPPAKHP